jgi:hypothetical protein
MVVVSDFRVAHEHVIISVKVMVTLAVEHFAQAI